MNFIKFILSTIVFILGFISYFITFNYFQKYGNKLITYLNKFLVLDSDFVLQISVAILQALIIMLLAYLIYTTLSKVKLIGISRNLVIIFFSSYFGAAIYFFIGTIFTIITDSIISTGFTGLGFVILLPVAILTTVVVYKYLDRHLE